MRNPATGKIDFNRMGWDNHRTGGRQLGSSINGRYGSTITKSINGWTFDASTGSAFAIGWSKGMQYSGLDRGDGPSADEALSNCFAATYSLITTMDNMGYSIETMASEPGSYRVFDAYVAGPITVFADTTVNFEMCEYNKIIDQVKNMAGLDYASMADNLVREALVLITESPEAMAQINSLKAAGECAIKVAKEVQEEVEGLIEDFEEATGNGDGEFEEDWGEEENKGGEGSENWGEENQGGKNDDEQFESFQADPEEIVEAAEEFAEDVLNDLEECINVVDMYTVGEISGKLFSDFFNSQIKPLT